MPEIPVNTLIQTYQDSSLSERVKMAARLIRAFAYAPGNEVELSKLHALLTLILDEPDANVRRSLSSAATPLVSIPRQLVITLANDTFEVAEPVLKGSALLSESDLLNLIQIACDRKQNLIAQRRSLREKSILLLAQKGNLKTILNLLQNPYIKLNQPALDAIITRFGHSEDVRTSLMGIDYLPVTVHMDLLISVTMSLSDLKQARNELPEERFKSLSSELIDRTMIHFLEHCDEDNLAQLAIHIKQKQLMTPIFLIRALCGGHATFCLHAFQNLSQLPLPRVLAILKKGNQSVLHSMLVRCGLPASIFKAFYAAITVLREYEKSEYYNNKYWLLSNILETITRYNTAEQSEEMSAIIAMLHKCQAEESRLAAREYLQALTHEEDQVKRLTAA